MRLKKYVGTQVINIKYSVNTSPVHIRQVETFQSFEGEMGLFFTRRVSSCL